MRVLIGVMAIGMVLGGAVSGEARAKAGQKGKKQAKHERVVLDERRPAVAVNIVFSSREVRVIREYYTPRYRNLPPGLQKKLRRTGQLPPGWRKKMEPFPLVVERELVVLPAGYQRGVIDGHAVIYNPRTQVILDVAVLF